MSDLWPQEGSYLGHYRLVQKLDEGGMGAVFKAHEAALDRYVAVKVLSPQLAQDEEFVRSFLREARAVAALNHPNIIQIYFIGQHDDYIYFAMEFIEGAALDRLSKLAQKPTPKEWIGYIRQAALGLQYAHNHGLIHRDIKPSNLLLNDLNMVKVADFGLARATGSPADSSLSVADSMGTPEYMSPEESSGEAVDHRSDIYSLGATLYHLLAGRPPFTGSSGTEIMMHQIHTPLPSVRKLNSSVTSGIAAVVEKCMAKKPGDRYQSYDQLIRGIDDALRKREAATRVPVPPSSTGKIRRPQQSSGGLGPFGWVVILCIIGAAMFGVWKIGNTQKKSQVQPLPPETGITPVKQSHDSQVKPPVKTPEVRPPATTQQTPPPPAHVWLPLMLVDACNRDVITRKPGGTTDGLVYDGSGVLMTTEVLRQSDVKGTGLPMDGMIPIPGTTLPGRFRLNVIRGNDCICLTPPGGKATNSVHVSIPPPMQQRAAQVAFLSTATFGSGAINVTLHYADGSTQTSTIIAIDAQAAGNGQVPPGDLKVAYQVQPKDKTFLYGLCSQIIPADPVKILRSLTLSLGPHKLSPDAKGDPTKFTAALFGISLLPARAAAATPHTPAQTNVAIPPPTTATNVAVAPPPAQTNATVESAPAETNVAVVPPPASTEMTPAAFRELSAKLIPLIASLQFDSAEAELKRLATAGGATQSAVWEAVGRDMKRLRTFKQRAIDGISEKSGRTVLLVYRNSQRLEAQLLYGGSEEITTRKQVPGGFVQSKTKWADLTGASILTIFGTVADPNNKDDFQDYNLALLYQAMAGQARIEDAQRAMTASAERDAKFKADAAVRIKWLEAWATPAATTAASTAETPDSSGEAVSPGGDTPRIERGVMLAAGPSRWNWQCFDLAAACNADVIYTESRAATDDFTTDTSARGWTTAGWLQRNNIAGDFNGIPDDGRLMLADNDPRLVFNISMPPRKSAIMLAKDSARWPRAVRLDLPAELRARYNQIAILHASTWGDATVAIDLIYTDGRIKTRRIQTLDWAPKARSHDLTPDQFTAVATRSNAISNMSRFEMVAEIISADDNRKLAALILTYEGIFGSTGNAARNTAGIFAISASPTPDR